MAATRKKVTKAESLKKEKLVVSETAEIRAAEETKAEAVKKSAAPGKTEAAKKTAAPETEAEMKAPEEKGISSRVYIQYMDKEILTEKLVAEAKKAYVKAGNKEADIRTIDVYIKPEESAAYYVVNGTGAEEYRIDL